MKKHPQLDIHQLQAVAKLFRMLAEPSRLMILQQLRHGSHTVTELVEALDARQANVSKQLAMLHDAGLVGRTRHGNHIEYAIADPMIFDLCNLVCGKLKRDAKRQAKLFV
jgi:ArsR family transcriptional regulator